MIHLKGKNSFLFRNYSGNYLMVSLLNCNMHLGHIYILILSSQCTVVLGNP